MTDLVLSSDRAAAARHQRIDPSCEYRLPEKFRDVRPADPNVPPQPSLAGGTDPFIASIYNGRHGTALRRVG